MLAYHIGYFLPQLEAKEDGAQVWCEEAMSVAPSKQEAPVQGGMAGIERSVLLDHDNHGEHPRQTPVGTNLEIRRQAVKSSPPLLHQSSGVYRHFHPIYA